MVSASRRPTGNRRSGPADQINDGPPPLWVARGRDDTGRLVDRVNDSLERRLADAGAVERDLVVGPDVARRIEHRLPSDLHAPGADDLLEARREATPALARNLTSRIRRNFLRAPPCHHRPIVDLDLVAQACQTSESPPTGRGRSGSGLRKAPAATTR